jgi:hypothetical protein
MCDQVQRYGYLMPLLKICFPVAVSEKARVSRTQFVVRAHAHTRIFIHHSLSLCGMCVCFVFFVFVECL